jgi:hypothetical protein
MIGRGCSRGKANRKRGNGSFFLVCGFLLLLLAGKHASFGCAGYCGAAIATAIDAWVLLIEIPR